MMKHLLIARCVFGVMVAVTALRAGEIRYIEDFALAEDRTKALAELIPGTEEYYYYHALHYQNTEQFDKVEDLLKRWIKQHNYTDRVREIQHRQALLTYPISPQESLEFVRSTLGLQFNHQRESADALRRLPTALDSNLISRETLTNRAMRESKNLNRFDTPALEWLVEQDLNPEQRRHLLSRLSRPDYPHLVDLIIKDLNFKGSRGFGSHNVHNRLLVAQLEECIERKPALLNDGNLVNAYLRKLYPSADADAQNSPAERKAFLERQWGFVSRLAPSHNSLKAHVLYHRLLFDREQGEYDKQRLMTYLRLPRQAHYVARDLLETDESRRYAANLGQDFRQFTSCAAVGSDEDLVRDYLAHFFVQETTFQPYEPYVNTTYLKELFAETKLVNGLGDAEQWYAMLPPEKLQALRDRIDLSFAQTNKRIFAVGEAVALDLDVKNVEKLIVKIYEINTLNYFRQHGHDVNTDIKLDGLIANQEQTFTFDESPLRRVRRHFEFPKLADAGVYVLDFIGNGRSSRAVIRKGQLRSLQRMVPQGHLFTIFDEQNQPLAGATLWLDGHEFTANDDGRLLVPFTAKPRRQTIVLSHAGRSSVDVFNHQSEKYQYKAGIYVDRESLVKHQKATVVVRNGLFLNGVPVSIKALKDVKLTITSADHDGVESKQEVDDFTIWEDRESEYEFQVPPRLARLDFAITAKVEVASRNEEITVGATESFAINEIDRTEKLEDLHFTQIDGQYFIELLGKSGEDRGGRPVKVEIRHRDFTDSVHVTLQTDAASQIALGELSDIAWVRATGPEGTTHTWRLIEDRHSQYANVHASVGETIHIPFMPGSDKPLRSELSLLETRGGSYATDQFQRLSIQDGYVQVKDLPAGDYSLLLKRTDQRVNIRVAQGQQTMDFVFGGTRQLEQRNPRPVQIDRVDVGDENVLVRLSGADKFTRVHVFASRFQPAHSAYSQFALIHDVEPLMRRVGPRRSLYMAGRTLGEEEQYILDRQFAKRFPGNMLTRPSLLLNPWDIRTTQTGQQQARAGGAFGEQADAAPAATDREGAARQAVAESGGFANLDFLHDVAPVLVNLAVKDGLVEIPRADLGPNRQLQIVAVDPVTTAYRTVSLPPAPRDYADLRLLVGLDPNKHYTRQKNITVIGTGETFEVADVSSARFASYDRLDGIFSVMLTLSGDAQLVEFEFVLRWPTLSDEEQRQLYSKYACHELNFYLFKKDPEFFEQVVRPYLAHKYHKTFMDHWLLGAELTAYLRPWNYQQLNIVERILLGQAVASEQPRSRQHVLDLFELHPQDVTRWNRLFESALAGPRLGTVAKADKGFLEQQIKMRKKHQADSRLETLADKLESREFSKFASDMPGSIAAGKNARPNDAKKAEGEPVLRERFRRSGAVRGAMVESLDEAQERANVDLGSNGFFGVSGMGGGGLGADRRFYQKLDQTKEWVENNYYRLPIEAQIADLVTVNSFWSDYAQHAAGPFFSTNWADASRNFTECMLAIAVLDLPLASEKHDITFDGPKMRIQAAGPMVVMDEQVREVQVVEDESPVLVKQNFYDRNDRYRHVDGERRDKFVTDEFVVHMVYGCQIVASNTSSSPQELDVLVQVPVGAIPVSGSRYTNTIHIELTPYQTQTVEYEFYFPAAGDFPHFPVHVSRNESLLGFAPAVQLHVVPEATQVDRTSWQYVSQNGSNDDVLKFLQENNPLQHDLEKIAFRMKDKGFAQQVYNLLTLRHVYHQTLWSYGIQHNLPEIVAEYLKHEQRFVERCGDYVESELLVINPVERKTYQHMDYKPLVNARAHKLGRVRKILNDRFHEQYHRLLKILSYRRELDNDDEMSVTYYMLLQDRIEEALIHFAKVNAANLHSRLQYDYFAAYLDCFSDTPTVAESIANRYADYPVDRWRNAFASMRSLVDEVRGGPPTIIDPRDRTQQQTDLAAKEPSFDFEFDAKQVKLTYQNLEQVQVNYYLVDLELLFSRNPFVQDVSGHFSHIRPNESQTVQLDRDGKTHTFALPETLHNQNVIVEIVGGGKTHSRAYYANSLDLQIAQNYGQLQVTDADSKKPLPQVYIKVYGRMQDGRVRFYKDGYTDLRGRFDFTSLNTNELDNITRFSLLVMSDNRGAVVREVAPPKR